MRDLPIIFSAPMVRAMLEDRKRMTRRALSRVRRHGTITEFGRSDTAGYDWHFRDAHMRWHDYRHNDFLKILPLALSDRLWVRENFWHACSYPGTLPSGEPEPPAWTRGNLVHYAADGDPPNCGNRHYGPDGLKGRAFAAPDPYAIWESRPSIDMPRWASRLTLIVESVQVERLQDISEADAIAEGIVSKLVECADGIDRNLWFGVPHAGGVCPRQAFFDLWDSINNPHNLCADDNPIEVAANPWVAAISFRVVRANIDKLDVSGCLLCDEAMS